MTKKNKHKQYEEALRDALEQLHDGLITKDEYKTLLENAGRIFMRRCNLETND